MIHLAGVGHEYTKVVNPDGTLRMTSRNVKHPTRTLCGRALGDLAMRILGDHADPRMCKECLRALPARKTSHVQAFLLPANIVTYESTPDPEKVEAEMRRSA